MKIARDPPAPISPGATFGGYRVDSLVARGGMGIVYRALDISLQRPVALKLIAPEFAEDERFRSCFLMEPRLAASLDHPSVVPIYEAGELHMHPPRRRREKHAAPRLCNARSAAATAAARKREQTEVAAALSYLDGRMCRRRIATKEHGAAGFLSIVRVLSAWNDSVPPQG